MRKTLLAVLLAAFLGMMMTGCDEINPGTRMKLAIRD